MAQKKSSASTGKKKSLKTATTPATEAASQAEKGMNIVVTLADHAVADAQRISRQLKKSGMTIETHLDSIGQYIGTSSVADVTRLKALEGVAAVEQLGEVQLPPCPLDPQ